jgi:hypothetical protein
VDFCSHLWQDGQLDFHQIATFLLLFPKTPILPTFDAIKAMAKWEYGNFGVKWPYSHTSIIASKVAIMGVFGNTNKNVAIW